MSSKFISINVNDHVWVKLTPAGEEMWNADWKSTGLYQGVPPEVRLTNTDHDGWIRFQLWELMRVFGSAMYNGSPRLPFEGNKIRLEHK